MHDLCIHKPMAICMYTQFYYNILYLYIVIFVSKVVRLPVYFYKLHIDIYKLSIIDDTV